MGNGITQTTCSIWGTTAVPWMSADWQWGRCYSVIPISPLQSLGVDANTLIQPWNPYRTSSLDKQKRLIKLVCKVNGQDYSEEKEAKDFPITVGDIRVTVKPLINIDLNLKMEE